ncbi:pyruvate formate lyase activating protein-like protein [Thermococcus onnurineus NA1]|uniref:Pyruvate formate lyase activating protein-like protein n=1 Tax=Thermococcus onnurineus (strain NA1) TaxID=523850 RepID=B6YVV4_THEON|nr:radical SAM protein [Thermococcus onnurineus]ACJ16277.1 pyruvate formate lyase activating protein-like protein [Thermococcus onnurineus NA1]
MVMWFRRIEIREIEGAIKAMPHYFAVLRGDEVPNFFLSKRVGVKFDEDAPLEELWEIHEEAMDRLKENDLSESPEKSLLDLKAVIADKILESCELCEFKCRANRKREIGYCRVKESLVASEFLHYGEEPELIPSYTVFFSGCNFRCVFCQNWDISQFRAGVEYPPNEMAEKITVAFAQGAKNVNFVGGEPTPNLPFIIKTLRHVKVPIPVVWNSNMYMSEEAMKLLDGVVDVYLADFKWGNDECALKYSKVPRYWEVITRNFLLAKRHYKAEFLIRHLVIPGHLDCCTRQILKWIAENIGKDVRINVMFQYRPEYEAGKNPEISRTLKDEEMIEAARLVREFGFKNALVG